MRPRVIARKEHIISRKNIDFDALKIMRRLNHNGHKAYLVGGSVRDLLLSKQPKDFDIATDATPKKIRNLFRNSRIIGKRFKLTHVYFKDNKIIEVATFRAAPVENSNIDTKEKTNENLYGNEATDALRRDITINALFYDLSNFSVIDYVGGIDDLNEKIIRVIGNPDSRFIEDPVRMLRVIRHASRTNFRIELSCVTALSQYQKLISSCPKARIYEELKRDLLSGYSAKTLGKLQEYKFLKFLFPAIASDNLFQKNSKLLKGMEIIDKRIRKKLSVSLALVLSVIFCTTQNISDYKSFLNAFKNKQIALEALNNFLKAVTVTRREKNDAAKIIALAQNMLAEKKVKKFMDDGQLEAKTLLSILSRSDLLKIQ